VLVLAGNQTHPRTPVLWEPAPECITVVNRAVDPVLHLEYSIPNEDTNPTADEVADSRRHQFLGFCRQFRPALAPPRWLSEADRSAALEKALILPGEVSDAELLDRSRAWSDCFVRITEDDDRRPITLEAAAMGVDWDTSALDPGTYVVQGYTWEPALNLYSLRPGVIRVLDGPDGDPAFDPGPSVALRSEDIVATIDQPFEFEACVRAAAGSSYVAEWSLDDTFEWTSFASGDVVNGGFSLSLPWTEETSGNEVELRVIVTDPLGRAYSGYYARQVFVAAEPGDDDTGGGPTGGGGDEDESGEDGDGGVEGGGGCGLAPDAPAWGLGWLWLFIRRSPRRTTRGRLRDRREPSGMLSR
jgi:hypothetical protein